MTVDWLSAGRDHFFTTTTVLRTRRLHFSTPGIHFGGPGTDGDTSWDAVGPRHGFVAVSDEFWESFGTHFGDSLDTIL